MKNRNQRNFCVAVCLLVLFVLWTIAVYCIDVQPIGPKGSSVGFASFNRYFHNLTGVHRLLYTITDLLGLVPLCIVLGFAGRGCKQLIHNKSILKVDHSLLVLGGFYIVVFVAYILFEVVVINYRPVLIEGNLEASYPSSTTLLIMCVMPSAIMQLQQHIQNKRLYKIVAWIMVVFTLGMVLCRVLAGVHWLSDIIGGVLLSAGLVYLYNSIHDYLIDSQTLNQEGIKDDEQI